MTNETRLMLMGFIATLLIALALVATYWLGQGWKMQKPFPVGLWVIPGQIAAIVVLMGAVMWWWRR